MSWTRKRKGTAYIYKHPDTFEGRAVVHSPYGYFFNGEEFPSLERAKKTALNFEKYMEEQNASTKDSPNS